MSMKTSPAGSISKSYSICCATVLRMKVIIFEESLSKISLSHSEQNTMS